LQPERKGNLRTLLVSRLVSRSKLVKPKGLARFSGSALGAREYAVGVSRRLVLSGLWILVCAAGVAQNCPGPDGSVPAASTLHGVVQYHDDLRQWIGLNLDKPACGQSEIQLTFSRTDHRAAKSISGCGATVSGSIFEGMTGHFSAELAIADPKIVPDRGCKPQPLEVDYSKVQPPRALQRYRASLSVDFSGKGHVEQHAWREQNQGAQNTPRKTALTPAPAYVHYMLAGSGEVLRFGCASGFRPVDPVQNPPNPDGFVEDIPNMTGTTLQSDTVNTITFDCVRAPVPPHKKPVSKK
jgi:hypothetical protein